MLFIIYELRATFMGNPTSITQQYLCPNPPTQLHKTNPHNVSWKKKRKEKKNPQTKEEKTGSFWASREAPYRLHATHRAFLKTTGAVRRRFLPHGARHAIPTRTTLYKYPAGHRILPSKFQRSKRRRTSCDPSVRNQIKAAGKINKIHPHTLRARRGRSDSIRLTRDGRLLLDFVAGVGVRRGGGRLGLRLPQELPPDLPRRPVPPQARTAPIPPSLALLSLTCFFRFFFWCGFGSSRGGYC